MCSTAEQASPIYQIPPRTLACNLNISLIKISLLLDWSLHGDCYRDDLGKSPRSRRPTSYLLGCMSQTLRLPSQAVSYMLACPLSCSVLSRTGNAPMHASGSAPVGSCTWLIAPTHARPPLAGYVRLWGMLKLFSLHEDRD